MGDQFTQTIREYIHAHKGVWVDIAMPDTIERSRLFWIAYNIAAKWKHSQ